MNPKPLLSRLKSRSWVVASLGDFAHLKADARAAEKAGADLLEIRADLFPSSVRRPEPLRASLRDLRSLVGIPLLLTLRRGEEGGGFSVAYREQDRLALFRAGLSAVDGVDVELAATDIARHVVNEARKRGRFVILSAHDFKKTPPTAQLIRWVKRAKLLRGDILKVAANPRSVKDITAFMDFCASARFPRQAFIMMGPRGQETRREGYRWGSCLTYGYVRKPLAPGQISVQELVASQAKVFK